MSASTLSKRIPADFGHYVQMLREAYGWSREELARKAGITMVTVYHCEKKHRTRLHAKSLTGLIDAFDLRREEVHAAAMDFINIAEYQSKKPGDADALEEHIIQVFTDRLRNE